MKIVLVKRDTLFCLSTYYTQQMDDRLKQLYQDVILVHSKNPFQYEKKEDSSFHLEANNPICGDRFQFYFEVENGKIKDCHFHGHGCAISKAASSILTQNIIGKDLEEVISYCSKMEEVIDPNAEASNPDSELLAFEAARHFPERAACATLS